jgi:hypothetical protein
LKRARRRPRPFCFCYTASAKNWMTNMSTITFDTQELVTTKDLQIELAPIKSDTLLIKWMLGLLLAGVASLILKAFF